MSDASTKLERLSDEFFDLQNTLDPLSATLLGIVGTTICCPTRVEQAARAALPSCATSKTRLAAIDADALSEIERVNAAVLARLAWGARVDLDEGIWETDASAESYSSPHSMVFMCVPSASVVDDASAEALPHPPLGTRGLL